MKHHIRIETPEGGGVQGTHVYLDGKEVQGIRKISIADMEIGKGVTVKLEISVDNLEIEGGAEVELAPSA
jgi:hypothetical protein